MEEFSQFFGLYPDFQKCNVFMAGVFDKLRDDICGFMGIEYKALPVKYLGCPSDY